MNGWNGNILEIDLTTQTHKTHPLDMEMARLFLGGRGLGARLLWDIVSPEVDPLSPENALIFTTGPITASGSQTSNRFNVSTKSPLTDGILHANSGGWWGMQFKRTGYDVLIVRGKAETPVLIEITKEGVAIKDASHLWGKGVFETTEALGQNRNKRNVLCIGPAGENLVRIAAIMNDKERALARGGAGAVMGSKKLKAIVVEGNEKNKPADPDQFKFMLYETGKLLKASPLTSQALPEFGTAVVMNVVNEIGALPTRNFQQSQFEYADNISGEEITDTILVKNQACWACPITCTRITKTKSGKEGEGPEFESAWAFGAQCGINDLDAITEANYLCNDMGLDTISMGNTIGCAMELAEKGLIKDPLGFGQADKLLGLIQDTAHRRGLGDELAEGSYRMAEKHGAPELSMSVKKLEMPAYDPRGMQGQGLVFATGNRGACHETGNMLGPEVLALPRLIDRFATQGKAGIVSVHQNSAAVIDSLLYCKFANMAVAEEFFARTLTAVTGEHFTADDLMMVGERVWNLERLYNLREGFSKADDTLPKRMLDEPVAEGPSKGFTVKLGPMLEEYYAFRGWDQNGVPKPKKLKELSLEFAIEAKMIDQRLYEEFRDIGRDIFVTGLTSSHGGNMSVRVGDKIIIKRRGAQFGRLQHSDFVETSFQGKDSGIVRASTELIVHRAIYEKTSALAVIHAHPRTAITLSLSRDEIIPIDNEGSYLLRKIPVVSVELASGSNEMAEAVSEALRGYKVIMQRGHGCFAIGQTLEEAYHWVSALEEVSDIILENKLLGEGFIEYRKHSESYSKW